MKSRPLKRKKYQSNKKNLFENVKNIFNHNEALADYNNSFRQSVGNNGKIYHVRKSNK